MANLSISDRFSSGFWSFFALTPTKYPHSNSDEYQRLRAGTRNKFTHKAPTFSVNPFKYESVTPLSFSPTAEVNGNAASSDLHTDDCNAVAIGIIYARVFDLARGRDDRVGVDYDTLSLNELTHTFSFTVIAFIISVTAGATTTLPPSIKVRLK